MTTTRLTIDPRNIIRALLILITFLVVCFTIGQIARHVFGYEWMKGFVPMFDLNTEANVPTWYSSSALLFAFMLLWFIADAKKRSGDSFARHWRALSLVVLYLSIDEAAQIHELASEPIRSYLDMTQASGLLHHTWILAGLVAVSVVGVAFIPFARHLPRRTFLLFLASAIIFVLGAIVLESIGGSYLGYAEQVNDKWTVLDKREDLVYSALYLFEELFEMLAVVLLIFSLFDYIGNHLGGITIAVHRRAEPAADK